MKVICESSMMVLIALMGYILMGEAFNRDDTLNKCGRQLSEAVTIICDSKKRSSSTNGISGLDFHSRRQIADECCTNTCTVGHILDSYCKYNS